MDGHFTQLNADCLLHFTGAQVPTFLQGQLSCDCQSVSASQSALGALCTAQGRVVTDCRVLQLDDGHYALRLNRGVRETTHATLKKYAMFSRTELSARDDDWHLLAVWGADAAAVLETALGRRPHGFNASLSIGSCLVCQADEAGEAFELVVADTALADVRTALAAQVQEAPEAAWQQNELRRGIIRTTAALSGKHVPQVLNYDLAGLLDFKKGCYIGQEVVARLHYKGRSKRRCAVYALPPDARQPQEGDGLVAADDGRTLGSVLRAIAVDAGDTLVIGLVTADDSEQPLTLTGAGASTLMQPVALPYTLRGSSAAS